MLHVLTSGRLGTAGVLSAAVVILGCNRDQPAHVPPAATSGSAARTAEYVGATTCAHCHSVESGKWRQSDHWRAMQPATAGSVAGPFDGSSFSAYGTRSTFFRTPAGYRVRTDGPGGRLQDFSIAYTFGFDPIQQYLAEFPKGRYQALSVVWDTRPKERGGQRRLHLYPHERIDSRDVLHWTKLSQNWNYMCADCHSTSLRKNYDAANDSYKTTWTDVNVACEACHGPGSAHVAWAGRSAGNQQDSDTLKGLIFQLKDSSGGTWAFAPGDFIAKRTKPPSSRAEIETCGRCHARRSQIWPDYTFGQPLEQSYRVALLDEDLYFEDGQQRDEVYEYGSFLQSRMYAEGVTCGNCHEPHTGKLRLGGNAICTQCHTAARYDAPSHHFHEAGSEGAQCVVCHMPARNYMVVDARRDHRFHIPRPDESVRFGTPNACTTCHDGKSARWAAEAVAKWYGPDALKRPSLTEAIHAGRTVAIDGGSRLATLVEDRDMPAIARATALNLLAHYSGPLFIDSLGRAAADEDPLVRRAAAEALESTDEQTRVRLGVPLLSDSVRSVRLEVVSAMVGIDAGLLPPAATAARDHAIAEFRAVQALNADTAGSWVNLGMLEGALGRTSQAETALRTAISREPQFVPAHVNLADLLQRTGREAEAERVLRAALTTVPVPAAIHHALGLSLVRQRRVQEGIAQLGRAAALASDDPRFAYVYAVALHDTGDKVRAGKTLEDAQRRRPADRAILDALVSYAIERRDFAAALGWARLAARSAPGDQDALQRLRQLESAATSRSR